MVAAGDKILPVDNIQLYSLWLSDKQKFAWLLCLRIFLKILDGFFMVFKNVFRIVASWPISSCIFLPSFKSSSTKGRASKSHKIVLIKCLLNFLKTLFTGKLWKCIFHPWRLMLVNNVRFSTVLYCLYMYCHSM